jgi:hypothetical protein
MPFAAAAALASPCKVTSGTPDSFGRISISFIAAAPPLEETPSDLNTASLPTQRAANDAWNDGWARQYAISASVKLREINVWFSVGTEDISSAQNCHLREFVRIDRKCTLINANSSCRSRNLECLLDRPDVREVRLHLSWLVLFERVATRLLVWLSTRQRVEYHRGLELSCVWGSLLDLHEHVGRHHLRHSLIRLEMALLVSDLVRLVQRGRRCGKHVAWIDNKSCPANLAETE